MRFHVQYRKSGHNSLDFYDFCLDSLQSMADFLDSLLHHRL